MINTIRQGEWMQIILPKEWEGITIEALFRTHWEAPKKLIHSFRMEKKVHINGEDANWNLPLPAGTKVQIRLFTEEEINVIPTFQTLEVLYEDDHLLVLNKPPFMNTHPNNPQEDTDTLLNAAQYYLMSQGEIRNCRQVHRLDQDTSGTILFAKHALAGAILDRMLEKREIKRTYLALVHGLFPKKQGTINEPIGRDRHHPTKRRVSPSGQQAVTHYQLIKEDRKNRLSYVKCWLETGRTHQIRVHLSYLGHPLAGDRLYGGKPLLNRQALHAAILEFRHPFTEEQIKCYAPFPDNPEIFKEINIYSI